MGSGKPFRDRDLYMHEAPTRDVVIRGDFPSSLELKRLSLAIYHGDPASAQRCRDAVLLVILAQLLERRVDACKAIFGIVALQRSDYSAGDGVLVVAGEELRLRCDWLSAAMRWLVFRGLRQGPLFYAIEDGIVVSQNLSAKDVLAIIQSWHLE